MGSQELLFASNSPTTALVLSPAAIRPLIAVLQESHQSLHASSSPSPHPSSHSFTVHTTPVLSANGYRLCALLSHLSLRVGTECRRFPCRCIPGSRLTMPPSRPMARRHSTREEPAAPTINNDGTARLASAGTKRTYSAPSATSPTSSHLHSFASPRMSATRSSPASTTVVAAADTSSKPDRSVSSSSISSAAATLTALRLRSAPAGRLPLSSHASVIVTARCFGCFVGRLAGCSLHAVTLLHLQRPPMPSISRITLASSLACSCRQVGRHTAFVPIHSLCTRYTSKSRCRGRRGETHGWAPPRSCEATQDGSRRGCYQHVRHNRLGEGRGKLPTYVMHATDRPLCALCRRLIQAADMRHRRQHHLSSHLPPFANNSRPIRSRSPASTSILQRAQTGGNVSAP